VAPDLLNKVIAVRSGDGWRWARIVEVEAYRSSDPASHSYGGPRGRNVVMYGPPAHLYVYFSYGMHWCANVVTGPEGVGEAVLLRAAEPLGGLPAMQAARGAGVGVRDLCRGPARLAQALGLDRSANGAPVAVRGVVGDAARGLAILDDGTPPPASPGVGPRVGITKAAEVPWRWWVADSPWVSPFKAGRRPAVG